MVATADDQSALLACNSSTCACFSAAMVGTAGDRCMDGVECAIY
jgi:hypothetical protein